jgi:hypothetical protein
MDWRGSGSVEYLGEQVNEVFNEFLKEKAVNTCPFPSGVGHGEVKGKETDADISKQGKTPKKKTGSPTLRAWKKLAREKCGVVSGAQPPFQAQGKRTVVMQGEEANLELGYKRGKSNGVSKYTSRSNEVMAVKQPHQAQ